MIVTIAIGDFYHELANNLSLSLGGDIFIISDRKLNTPHVIANPEHYYHNGKFEPFKLKCYLDKYVDKGIFIDADTFMYEVPEFQSTQCDGHFDLTTGTGEGTFWCDPYENSKYWGKKDGCMPAIYSGFLCWDSPDVFEVAREVFDADTPHMDYVGRKPDEYCFNTAYWLLDKKIPVNKPIYMTHHGNKTEYQISKENIGFTLNGKPSYLNNVYRNKMAELGVEVKFSKSL